MDEQLKERAREWIQKQPEIFRDWGRGMADEILAAFASSILEGERQQIEALTREREAIMQSLYISFDAELAADGEDAYELPAEPEPLYFNTLSKTIANYAALMNREFSKLEQQLAEARAQESWIRQVSQILRECKVVMELQKIGRLDSAEKLKVLLDPRAGRDLEGPK